MTVSVSGDSTIHILGGTDQTEIGNVSDALKVSVSNFAANSITYSAAAGSFNLAALATDIFTITGSGTKTISITEISISFTGGGEIVFCQLLKRSTANSAGTATTLTNVPHDSTNAAATATVKAYTANPTLGTLVGAVRVDRVNSPLPSSSTQPGESVFAFGVKLNQPITLRGTGEVLAFNFNAVTLLSGTAVAYVEWTEA